MRVFAALALVAVINLGWLMYRMDQRARQMNADTPYYHIRATGILNETLTITDTDQHADALDDLSVIREHVAEYRKLGFVLVRIETAAHCSKTNRSRYQRHRRSPDSDSRKELHIRESGSRGSLMLPPLLI